MARYTDIFLSLQVLSLFRASDSFGGSIKDKITKNLMKIVVLQRENKKRLLIDTLEVPDYQDRYLQEDGTEFGAVEVKQKKPKKKAVKKAVKKVAKKPSKSSKK